MAYEFTKLSSVEAVPVPSSDANVLIEENGIIKKAPKSAVGGGGGAASQIIEFQWDDEGQITNLEDFKKAYENDMTIHIVALTSEYNTSYSVEGILPNIKSYALFYNGYYDAIYSYRTVVTCYDGSYQNVMLGIQYNIGLDTGELNFASVGYWDNQPNGFTIVKCYATDSV